MSGMSANAMIYTGNYCPTGVDSIYCATVNHAPDGCYTNTPPCCPSNGAYYVFFNDYEYDDHDTPTKNGYGKLCYN